MARQIAVIDGGRILQAGARDEVLQHPRTRRVAEHVGVTNIFQGTVADAGAGRPTIAWYQEQLTCLASLPPAGTSVEFCIRPEDVRLVWPEKAGERPNILRGHLTAEVERGVDYLMKFRADGRAVEASEIEIHCSEHLHYLMKLHPGKQVFIAFPPDKLHVLAPVENA